MKLFGPLIHSGQLFQWLASKGNDVRETYTLTPTGDPKETVEWLEWRGYRVAIIPPFKLPRSYLPVANGSPMPSGFETVSKAGVLFGRKNQPMYLAQVGDVLIWDGQNVVIEES